ncbi:MAG: type III secretion system chaperone [Gammaproteobacteria bacterium]|nr:type III secretion system chaperone [Gammaproteobacteria bacterium]
MSLAVMENLLAEFGAGIGIPDLRPDEEHRCNLMIDDVAVSFELGKGDESLYIYALLGPVPEGDEGAVYAALLHANYSFEGTRGSTLGIDPQTGGIVLIREERLESLRLPGFESIVEEFVDVAEGWMKRIDSGDFKPQTAESQADSISLQEGMMRV